MGKSGDVHRHVEFTLARFEKHLAFPKNPSRAQRFQQRELPVVEFCKGDRLGVAVELCVFLYVVHDDSRENRSLLLFQ
jgi:hypothetical protein